MRVLSVAAAVVLVLLGMAAPARVAAQEDPGHILFTVRFCSVVHADARMVGTFEDVPCDPMPLSGYEDVMVISLDHGEFVDGGSTLTLPFASMLNGNLYVLPGDDTLTITVGDPSNPLVSSIDIHIVSGETLPLTYTVTYGLALGSELPPMPVDDVPKVPGDDPRTPVTAPQVPAGEIDVPVESAPAEEMEGGGADTPDVAAVATTLPNTGAGRDSHDSMFTTASVLLAASGIMMMGAMAMRMRRA